MSNSDDEQIATWLLLKYGTFASAYADYLVNPINFTFKQYAVIIQQDFIHNPDNL